VHFDGIQTAIYFAHFPPDYLHTLRDVNIDLLLHLPKIKLHHTCWYNLLLPDQRTEFIRHFVALLRFVAAGECNVGHLGREREAIHRTLEGAGEQVGALWPGQMAMDEREVEEWRAMFGVDYAEYT
jgi:hypothetical protein